MTLLYRCGVLRVVCETNRDAATYYDDQINMHRNVIVNMWLRCVALMRQTNVVDDHNLTDKDRDAIKNAFSVGHPIILAHMSCPHL
jgi:hypothetical protein